MNTTKVYFQITGILSLVLAVAVTVTANTDKKTRDESLSDRYSAAVSSGVTEDGLDCKVTSTAHGAKLITITNLSNQIIAKDTQIFFDNTTGVKMVIGLRSNLKPRRTQVIHFGRFDGIDCKCRINRI